MNIGVVSAVPPVLVGVAVGLVALLLRGVALRRGRRDRNRLIEGPLLRRLLSMPAPAQGPLGAILFAVGVGALAAAAAGTGAAGPDRGYLGGPETVLVLDASNSHRRAGGHGGASHGIGWADRRLGARRGRGRVAASGRVLSPMDRGVPLPAMMRR